jgi:hypothetical protein
MQKHLWEQIHDSEWKQEIVLASVPLWKYNDDEVPIAVASACLIDYLGSRFVLSIAHASIAVSTWNAEIKTVSKDTDSTYGTTLQPVNMGYLTEINFEDDDSTEPKIVDFTYRKVKPDTSSYHDIALLGDGQTLGAARTVFTPNFDIVPSPLKKYGFYGKVRFGGVEGRRIIFEDKLEHDLTYVREEGEYFIFKLSHKYGSHDNYRGCSGAPIIDEDLNLIGLVSYGVKSQNLIYAINIAKYRAALEIETKPI